MALAKNSGVKIVHAFCVIPEGIAHMGNPLPHNPRGQRLWGEKKRSSQAV